MVEKYRDANAWNALRDLDIKALHDGVAHLMMEAEHDELAKRFDALILTYNLVFLMARKSNRLAML